MYNFHLHSHNHHLSLFFFFLLSNLFDVNKCNHVCKQHRINRLNSIIYRLLSFQINLLGTLLHLQKLYFLRSNKEHFLVLVFFFLFLHLLEMNLLLLLQDIDNLIEFLHHLLYLFHQVD